MIGHHFRMFRRRDWNRTHGFAEDLLNAVDYDMFLQMSQVCHIHHINDILYLRRLHGDNTSILHKDTQTHNNSLVISRHLERLGLSDLWEPFAPDPEQPRRIVFRSTK